MIFLFLNLLLLNLWPGAFGDSCEVDRFIDLTWSFSNKSIYWPGVQPFEYTSVIADRSRGFWLAMNEFRAGEHGGTHIDAPYHFDEHGWKVADIPIKRLIAKGALLDLTDKRGGVSKKDLLPEHLLQWEKENGPFETGTVLLIKYGRSQLYSNRTQYLGIDSNGNLNFPGISKKAAQWIADSGKFYGVGVDTASADRGGSKCFLTHRILLKKQIYILENIKLLEDLPAKGFNLIVFPMKAKFGTGGPLRIMAVPKCLV